MDWVGTTQKDVWLGPPITLLGEVFTDATITKIGRSYFLPCHPNLVYRLLLPIL